MERTLTEAQVQSAIKVYKGHLKNVAAYYQRNKEEVKRKRNLRYANSILLKKSVQEGGQILQSS